MRINIRYVTSMAVLALAANSYTATAQEPMSTQYEHIKGLEPFVGYWQGDLPSTDGGTITAMGRLSSNKSYLQIHFTVRSEDERTHIGTIIVGRDFASDQLMMWGFWPDQQVTGSATISENTVSWKSNGTTADGAESSSNVAMSVDGDELTVSVTNSRRGDEERPDMNIKFAKREWRRDSR
jgi:hypothetical protein